MSASGSYRCLDRNWLFSLLDLDWVESQSRLRRQSHGATEKFTVFWTAWMTQFSMDAWRTAARGVAHPLAVNVLRVPDYLPQKLFMPSKCAR